MQASASRDVSENGGSQPVGVLNVPTGSTSSILCFGPQSVSSLPWFYTLVASDEEFASGIAQEIQKLRGVEQKTLGLRGVVCPFSKSE